MRQSKIVRRSLLRRTSKFERRTFRNLHFISSKKSSKTLQTMRSLETSMHLYPCAIASFSYRKSGKSTTLASRFSSLRRSWVWLPIESLENKSDQRRSLQGTALPGRGKGI
jgi:hypothetical protein